MSRCRCAQHAQWHASVRVTLAVLRGLNLLQIEQLAQQWVRQTDGNSSSWNGVKVAVIVVSVVAANREFGRGGRAAVSRAWWRRAAALLPACMCAPAPTTFQHSALGLLPGNAPTKRPLPTRPACRSQPAVAILGAVALFIWLRRRRRTQQLAAPGMHPGAITTVGGVGGGLAPAPSTDTPSSQDAKEESKLEHLDSAERGSVPAAGSNKQGFAMVDIELAVAAGNMPGGLPRLSAIPSSSGGTGGRPSGISSGGTGSGGSGGTVAAARGMVVAGQVSQDGVQGVAALWAAAAAQGAAAGWPPGMPASHPVAQPGTATRSTASPTMSAAATDHMQMDEQEMMRLGSNGAVWATGAPLPHG